MDDNTSDRIKQVIHTTVGSGHGSLNAFAHKLGVNKSVVSLWINGKREISLNYQNLFFRTFGVNQNWLITGEGEMFEKEIIQIKTSKDINSIVKTSRAIGKSTFDQLYGTIKDQQQSTQILMRIFQELTGMTVEEYEKEFEKTENVG